MKKESSLSPRTALESKEVTSHPLANDPLSSSSSNPINNLDKASLPPSSTSVSAGNFPLTFSPSTGPEFNSLPLLHSEPKKKSLLLQDQKRNPFGKDRRIFQIFCFLTEVSLRRETTFSCQSTRHRQQSTSLEFPNGKTTEIEGRQCR